ncbi:hypothetical protein C8J57DRAFT_1336979 [Mycena rebaudengoi]|nr:hypothetical protein C8J57DRAFT_1336979 [Mycena rebaudengoi]
MLIVPRKALIPVDDLLGPWLIGVIVSSIVFGVTCLQIYLYYTKYSSRDSKFVDTLHLVFISMAFYESTVTNFGDYGELGAQIFVGGLLETLVQIFYAVRVWLLSGRSLLMPILIVSPNILKIAVRLRTAVFKNSAVNIPYATGSLAFGVACDFFITTSMIYWLLKGRSQFRRTNTALNTLILYTINSGLFVMIFAICCLITFLTLTTTLIYAFFFFVASRLYLCSLLSVLNSREHVRGQLYNNQNTDHPMVTISTSNFTTPSDNTKTAASEDPVRTFDRGVKGGPSSYNAA